MKSFKLKENSLEYKLRDFYLPLGEGLVTNIIDNVKNNSEAFQKNNLCKLTQYIPLTIYHIAYNYLLAAGYDNLMKHLFN